MSAQRKDDHVRLAIEQQDGPRGVNQFDEVTFVHHALVGIDRQDVSLATAFAGVSWPVPIYINAMTGGSAKTGIINRDLAIAARETGVPIASGSMNAYFKDPSCADTFSVLRKENPDGFVIANVNANATVDNVWRAIELIRADALQIHVNTAQETAMPEGDREFSHWPGQIEKIASAVDVPVILKEVGNGLSRQTVLAVKDLGVSVADVSGRGGTDFARIENGRRELGEYAFLHGWGQSAPACLLDAQGVDLPLLASGGVRNPLDVARALALGAKGVGASGGFLRTLLDGGVDALIGQLTTWLDQLAALQTMLGARTPADLTRCDLLIQGSLRSFCAERGIETGPLARRTSSAEAHRETTGSTR
ncbi:type 2 isopentenyl-diphosphate Delta-isomerase [Streptomyces galbus]|uniref:Isopentenyl-diphosphate delta-isomerase n=1 Tax=Streptomyces galbus TaxID=33898 RepID=A0A4U5WYC4_STRGB|nr:type 2 isopentenyl-diphosphate Delta-isomerase [Streptomyces galbus]TKT05946.1 type 2 isopentenyl-diphosphate Delta-isomerase [Streptomyces galbus]GHD54770.1 isopentenyl-diphosphate delta-isomerase [Streptomyces galbus]